MAVFDWTVERCRLSFRRPATTSRGVYTERLIWIVRFVDPHHPARCGVGEAAPLIDLSPEIGDCSLDRYEERLREAVRETAERGSFDRASWIGYSSICFAIESALASLHQESALFASAFALGEAGIRINGLVWMGSFEQMMGELEQKISDGFRCVKCKIGAIDWEAEVALLTSLRERYSSEEIELRVDANGAFDPATVMRVLDKLARLEVHSIEQPIRQGQWPSMASLIQQSPLPIALDEELIGWNREDEQLEMLEVLQPHYIVLKPTLHGGVEGVKRWVSKSRAMGVGSWVTSALESNIGLEMIARFSASLYADGAVSAETFPQGLGTGALYESNFPTLLYLKGDVMWLDPGSEVVPKGGSFGSFTEIDDVVAERF